MACRREEAAAASIAAAARSPTPAIRTPAHQSQAVFTGGKYFLDETKKYFLLKEKSFLPWKISLLKSHLLLQFSYPMEVIFQWKRTFSACDTFVLE